MKLTLEQTHRLLAKASALIVDDDPSGRSNLEEIEGIPKHEFFECTCVDDEGLEFRYAFNEADNQESEWDAPNLVLNAVDSNDCCTPGQPVSIKLMVPMDSSTHWFSGPNPPFSPK